jgi:hypothetical protein
VTRQGGAPTAAGRQARTAGRAERGRGPHAARGPAAVGRAAPLRAAPTTDPRRWRLRDIGCGRNPAPDDGGDNRLYRAIDRDGRPVDAMLSEHRDMAVARAFLRSARAVTGAMPDR